MKNKKIITIFIILLLLIIYLTSAFLMKDKNKFWCNLSFGDFKPIKYCEANLNVCEEPKDDFLCINGIFDLLDTRNNEVIRSMKDYEHDYPILLKNEEIRFKSMDEVKKFMKNKSVIAE